MQSDISRVDAQRDRSTSSEAGRVDRDLALPISPSVRQQLHKLERTAQRCLKSNDRMAIHTILDAVFSLVSGWTAEGRLKEALYQALEMLKSPPRLRYGEPYSIILYCAVQNLDDKTRSKWCRALRYAATNKGPDKSVTSFIKRREGLNACASAYARDVV